MLFISSGDDDAHACPFALTMILLGVGEGERQQLGENYFFFVKKVRVRGLSSSGGSKWLPCRRLALPAAAAGGAGSRCRQDVGVRTPDSFVVGGSDCVVRCVRARTGAGAIFYAPFQIFYSFVRTYLTFIYYI
jgi:hypothetical protein